MLVSGRNGQAAVDHLALSVPNLPSSQFPSHKSRHSSLSCLFLCPTEPFSPVESFSKKRPKSSPLLLAPLSPSQPLANSLLTPLPQRLRFAISLRASRPLIPSSAPRQRRFSSRVK